MDEMEKVEKLRARAEVTADEARNALKACDGDLLDAMVFLEKIGKAKAPSEVVVTTSRTEHTTFEDVQDTVDRYDREAARPLSTKLKHLFSIIMDKLSNNFLRIEHKGEELIKVKLWIVVLVMLFVWHVSIVAIIISLFFGVRYSFVGRDDMTEANKLIGKASEAASYVKDKFDKL
jgi:hypothetical protein